MNLLWIINKYVNGDMSQKFYPIFLANTQKELANKGYELSFVFFSELVANNDLIQNKIVFRQEEFIHLSAEDIEHEAHRIEKEYSFTLKQAYFADIVQTFDGQDERKITVPKKDFKDLSFLVPRFIFLENLIVEKNIDVIFSDVSPEVEMEFGRAIGNKLDKIVLKSSEGSALGKTVLFQSLGFGKDRLVEPNMSEFTVEDAEKFCQDFIENQRPPYLRPKKLIPERRLLNRINNRIKDYDFFNILKWPFKTFSKIVLSSYYLIERKVLKPFLYDSFDPNIPYIFIGFHLNSESTMVLRAQPFTNQTALVEMISRVLPYNYTLYVRAHPHWPDTYPFSYLAKMINLPNVKILSHEISVHEIISNSKAILTYNATTGIEALIYGKPVLSFASNIYKEHPAVDYCGDLFELGEKLTKTINSIVYKDDTFNFISKIKSVSISFLLDSNTFISEQDSKDRAIIFSDFLFKSIDWCKKNRI